MRRWYEKGKKNKQQRLGYSSAGAVRWEQNDSSEVPAARPVVTNRNLPWYGCSSGLASGCDLISISDLSLFQGLSQCHLYSVLPVFVMSGLW